MSDQPSNTFIDAVVSVFSFLGSIRWSLRISQLFSVVYSVVYFPFRLVLYPLGIVVNLLLVLFAPAIYAGSLILSIVQSIFAFFASLEPLYSFFGAAAGVGIFAGIVIAIFSVSIASRLGMYDEHGAPSTRPSSKLSYLDDSPSRRDSSSTDMDWQYLDSPSRRRRSALGLLSQTIHEEDDSEY